ncbi:MAG: response regulator [Verrucomicrobiota bacterium]|jgi:two-component system chemotaxis response regulator CheY
MNASPMSDTEPQAPTASPPKRVLIVDDDEPVRDAISSVLRNVGYEVLQSGDGPEALAEFDPKEIDLVLLDLNLPSQSGWDTFEGFTNRNPTLPIIIITGQSQQSEMAMAAGVGALMEKPLDAGQLLQTVEELLNEPEEARLRRVCGYARDSRYVSRYIKSQPSRVKLSRHSK